jgi:ABC-type multidrug transport system ATPase subunit
MNADNASRYMVSYGLEGGDPPAPIKQEWSGDEPFETRGNWPATWANPGRTDGPGARLLVGAWLSGPEYTPLDYGPHRAVISVAVSPTVPVAEDTPTVLGVVHGGQMMLLRLVPSAPVPPFTVIRLTSTQRTSSATVFACDVIPDFPVSTEGLGPMEGMYVTPKECTDLYVLVRMHETVDLQRVQWTRMQAKPISIGEPVTVDRSTAPEDGLAVYYLRKNEADVDALAAVIECNGDISCGHNSALFGNAVTVTRPETPDGMSAAFFSDGLSTVAPDAPDAVSWFVTVGWARFAANDTLTVRLMRGTIPLPVLPTNFTLDVTDVPTDVFVPLSFDLPPSESMGALCLSGWTVDWSSPFFVIRGTLPRTAAKPQAGLEVTGPDGVTQFPRCLQVGFAPNTTVIVEVFVPEDFVGIDTTMLLDMVELDDVLTVTGDGVPANRTLTPGEFVVPVQLPDATTPYAISLTFTCLTDDASCADANGKVVLESGVYALTADGQEFVHFGRMFRTTVKVNMTYTRTGERGFVDTFRLSGTVMESNASAVRMSVSALPIARPSIDGDAVPLSFSVASTTAKGPLAVAPVRVDSLSADRVVLVTFSHPLAWLTADVSAFAPPYFFDHGSSTRFRLHRGANTTSIMSFAETISGGPPSPDTGSTYVWAALPLDAPLADAAVTVRASSVRDCGVHDASNIVVDCVGVYKVKLPTEGPAVVMVETMVGGGDGHNWTTGLFAGPPGYFPTVLPGLAYPRDWIYVPAGRSLHLLRRASSDEWPIHLRVIVEPEVVLCHPVLLCSGHGVCGSNVTSPCECLEGVAYGWSGEHCEVEDGGAAGVLLGLVLAMASVLACTLAARSTTVRKSVARVRARRGDGQIDREGFVDEALPPQLLQSQRTERGEFDSRAAPLLELHAETGDSLDMDPVRIEFDSICVEVRDHTTKESVQLLRNISIRFAPRSVTAVMGSSGSGKTTLLRVMAGWLTPSSGTVTLNGDTRLSPKTLLRSVVSLGFVPRDDVLAPQLTVRESLYHAARMRTPKSSVRHRKSALVDTVLRRLDLESVADAPVGTPTRSVLSSGQRRRVSIGMELVSECSVLVLDEPTSGLSGLGALQIMQVLGRIAASGVTVVAVIHQPRRDMLRHIDQLAVLSNGQLRYLGQPTAAAALRQLDDRSPDVASLLSSGPGVNVADIVVDHVEVFPIVTFESLQAADRRERAETRRTHRRLHLGGTGAAESDSSSDGEDVHSAVMVVPAPMLARPRAPRRLPWRRQVVIFTKLAALQTVRSPATLAVIYGSVTLTSLLLGIAFSASSYIGPPLTELWASCPPSFQDECSVNQDDTYLSQSTMVTTGLGLSAALSFLSTFGGIEREVCRRNSRTGVQDNSAYFLGKALSDMVHLILAPLLFTVIFAYLSAPTMPITSLYVVAFNIYFVCSAISYVTSIIASDSRSLVLATGYVVLCITIGAFFPAVRDVEARMGDIAALLLPRLTYAHWAVQSYYLSAVEPYAPIYDTQLAISTYHMNESEGDLAFIVPLLMGFIYRIIAVLIIVFTPPSV